MKNNNFLFWRFVQFYILRYVQNDIWSKGTIYREYDSVGFIKPYKYIGNAGVI